jgi:26S proteasome regulatory subunit N1
MEEAIAAVLPYIQTYLNPQVIVTQGDSWEDSYFLRGLQNARDLGIPHIKLTHAARDLMWLAALDSTALRCKCLSTIYLYSILIMVNPAWNDIHVEFLIQAPRNSAGSFIRIIRSLERADFLGCSPSLTIELPSQVDSGLLHFLEKLKWLSDTPGKLTLRRRIQLHETTPHEAALRTVEAFYPRNPLLSHVLVLSPDMELAPSFFHYLMYIMLKYRHSTRSQTIHSNLFGVSLELPLLQLTNDEPSQQPNLDKTQFVTQNIPGSVPLFLWQAPNSNAALYFGDKWAELHSFLSQRLAVKDTAANSLEQEKVISKRYPAFLEFMHELLRARGYYLLYPALPVNGRLSIAKFHDDLFQIPEEFAKDKSESRSNGRQGLGSSEISLSEASTLMPLLDTFSLELPDISHLPLLSDQGKEMSELDFAHDAENYLREFRVRYGGCPEDLLVDDMSAEKLFCTEGS